MQVLPHEINSNNLQGHFILPDSTLIALALPHGGDGATSN